MNKRKNIFISHVHEDDKMLDRLKNLIEKNGMGVNDSSIYSGKPNNAENIDYIRQEILKPALDHAGTVLILISKGMRESVHVNWEINYAKKHDKNEVGVFAPGTTDNDIPNAFQVLVGSLIAGESPIGGWRGDQMIIS